MLHDLSYSCLLYHIVFIFPFAGRIFKKVASSKVLLFWNIIQTRALYWKIKHIWFSNILKYIYQFCVKTIHLINFRGIGILLMKFEEGWLENFIFIISLSQMWMLKVCVVNSEFECFWKYVLWKYIGLCSCRN